jgi:hypothetical protein
VLFRLHRVDPEPPKIVVMAQLTVSPVDGMIGVERFTVPVKPFWLVMVTVKLPVRLVDANVSAAKRIVNGAVEPLM